MGFTAGTARAKIPLMNPTDSSASRLDNPKVGGYANLHNQLLVGYEDRNSEKRRGLDFRIRRSRHSDWIWCLSVSSYDKGGSFPLLLIVSVCLICLGGIIAFISLIVMLGEIFDNKDTTP
jgi:hypothetical protein